jgi:hypothetical protein
MEYLWFIALAIVVGVGLWQLAVWVIENRFKGRQYKAACARALREGKPLLVAGGPWGVTRTRRRLNRPAHGGGDVCLDIDCRAFDGHPRAVVASVTHIPFAASQALDELNRVAEAVYIVYPSRQSFSGWLVPDHHLWVWQKDSTTYLRQRGRSSGRRAAEHYV